MKLRSTLHSWHHALLILLIARLRDHVSAFNPAHRSISMNRQRFLFYKEHDRPIALLPLSMQRNDNKKDMTLIHENHTMKETIQSSRREWLMKLSSSTSAAASILYMRTQNAYADDTALAAQKTSSTILCDPSVSIFYNSEKQRTVYLLGTAHISSKSADAAAQLVADMRPKAVFVELDAKRVGRAIPKPNPDNWPMPSDKENQLSGESGNDNESALSTTQTVTAETTTTSVPEMSPTSPSIQQTEQPQQAIPKQRKFFDFREIALRKGTEVVGNSIKGLYSKLEAEGFNAGEEFVVAVKEGLKINSKIILGDQDVEVTLRRLTEALAKTDLKKLLAADSELEENMKQLLPTDIDTNNLQKNGGEMSSEQLRYFVETVKAKDNVRLLMSNLKSVAPEVYRAMVSERDEYMANGLDKLDQFESIVAVMGIAHVDGVENTLKSRGWVEIKPLCDAT